MSKGLRKGKKPIFIKSTLTENFKEFKNSCEGESSCWNITLGCCEKLVWEVLEETQRKTTLKLSLAKHLCILIAYST
ncbi:hypothetical protein [Geoglobus acetivorans]|uniref:hypothetical protein n=1 Tax=Geoglobus acetivorans TaxID=565033 RepID=UPI0011DD2D62